MSFSAAPAKAASRVPGVADVYLAPLPPGGVASEPSSNNRPVPHTIAISLLRGANLVVGDADRGTSDPYVKLKLGPDGAAQKSRVIKGTLAPTWDERFEFRGTLGGARGAQLILAVYDHDGLSFNDSLGEAHLSLASLNRIEFAAEHRTTSNYAVV